MHLAYIIFLVTPHLDIYLPPPKYATQISAPVNKGHLLPPNAGLFQEVQSTCNRTAQLQICVGTGEQGILWVVDRLLP